MIPVRSSQHLRRILVHFRENNGMTRRTLGERLFVTTKTIANRELGQHKWDTDSVIDVAHLFGYDLMLMPQRPPYRRYTGTGWPT